MSFFTIITATYNAATTLPRLLESLAEQTCRDFELIIQDGASKDDTVAVAESYRDRLPFLSLASEPDTGIYDAWNKALPRIRGEWVLFLGADDLLTTPQVLEHAKNILSTFTESVLFGAGNLVLVDSFGDVQRTIAVDCTESFQRLRKIGNIPLPHSALLTRQTLLANNAFDASYKIAGDYDFLCRTWKNASQAKELHLCITNMALGGISSSPENKCLLVQENETIWKKYFPVYYYCHEIYFTIKKNAKALAVKTPLIRLLWNITKKIKWFLCK